MTVDDRTRLELHRKLEAVLGPEEADTLMAHLPPVTWHDVATKDDLEPIHTTVTASAAQLRTEMNAIGAQLRTEIDALGTRLHTEINALGTRLHTEMDALGTRLHTEVNAMGTQLRTEMQTMRAELHADFVEATNRQIKWLVTFAAAWSSLLVTVVQMIP